MDRRRFLTVSLAGALGVAARGAGAQAAERPNVVLIMSDDMGISDLGCYGGEIETPNLDALAAGGLRFRNFYCEPMCIPARATLLTGIYETKSIAKAGGLSKNCLTIAEALRSAGYATAMSGKWHLSDAIPPRKRGFERYFGTTYGAGSFFAPLSLMRDDDNGEAEFLDEDFYYTDAISDNAVDYIEQTPRDKPLFLYTAYTAAHWPLHARPSDIEKYKGKYAMGWDALREQRFARMQKLGVVSKKARLSPRDPQVAAWAGAPNKAWQQRRMEVYAAQITVMDEGIGRIVDALKRTGRFENTIVLFTVDNGACHVEYGPNRTGSFLNDATRDGRPMRPGNLPEIMPGPEDTFQSVGRDWANASNTPYRYFKLHAHEGGIRNPLIAHWPKGIAARGAITDAMGHMIDIMPTLLEATGAPHLKRHADTAMLPMDGESILNVFRGKEQAEHAPLFWAWANGKAAIKEGWKIVRLKGKPWELYHLEEDPCELNDLAAQRPDKVAALQTLYDAWAAEDEKGKATRSELLQSNKKKKGA